MEDASSKDLGVHAHVFAIAEHDALEEISAKLHRLHQDGTLQTLQAQQATQARRAVERPKPVEGLVSAERDRTWLHDPSVTISKDITDHQGRLIVRAGTHLNPLKQVSWRRPFVFIDGDNAAHRTWLKTAWPLKEEALKVVLVKGAPLSLSEDVKMPVYFDQGGLLTQRFGIKALPAVIRQDGLFLRVSEIALKKGQKK